MPSRMRLIAWLVTFTGAALAAPSADPFSVMRDRARELMCWPAHADLPGIAGVAKGFSASLNATCYWGDINYDDPTDRADWSTLMHLVRASAGRAFAPFAAALPPLLYPPTPPTTHTHTHRTAPSRCWRR